MIYRKGDITSNTTGVLINGVNCQGRMGSGVAKAYLDKWPIVKTIYLNDHGSKGLGDCRLIHVGPGLYVANCYTQEFFGYDGKKYASYNAIENSVFQAASAADALGVAVKTPYVGCGLGGMSWDEEVQPLLSEIEKAWGEQIEVWAL